MFKSTCFFIFTLLTFNAFNQYFEELSNDVGLDYIHPGNDHQEVGAGIVVFDVNNDGWDDIFQCGGTFPSKLWINKKGTFIDATEDYQIKFLDSLYVQGASSADYDNDGYDDLFISNLGISSLRGDNSPPVLLKNMGGKYFKPVFTETFSQIGQYPGCVWGDINNDGFVDLYVLNYVETMSNDTDFTGYPINYKPVCLENKLYINNQGNGFTEMSKEWGLNDNGCGLAAYFTDFDNDNDIDLILLNDFGHFNHKGNKLFRNDYPLNKMTDVSDSLGFYTEFYGMGVGPGDYNNDGYLDYYLTNIGKNYFLENSNGSFTDKADIKNIDLTEVKPRYTGTSWSGLFLDLENDGDVDLFVAKGYLESIVKVVILDQNKLFVNNKGSFSDVSKGSGINDSLAQRGAALIDYNHDGQLDIVTNELSLGRSEFAKTDQKIKLFKNRNDKNNWIGIKLTGTNKKNYSCVGCSVSFPFGDGFQIREVDGGSGHSSQSTKTLYFGLGDKKKIKNIEIKWLSEKKTYIKQLKAGKVYQINRNGKIKKLY